MKQGKSTAAKTDSLFFDRLRKMHGDLHAAGQKAVDCVVPTKVQAKARDFLRGLEDAPDKSLRAVDAVGYAIDVLLFTPSMSGHTAIDRAIRTGKIGGAANLMRQATFRLLEIAKDNGGRLLAATDLASNEELTVFDTESPMARGGRWARRTCLYQGVHVAFGPLTPLDDDLLAVAAPFIERGRALKKPLRCAEALYDHFIRYGNPLNGVDLDLFADDDDDGEGFPFDASDGPLHALAAEWARESQLPEPDAAALQLIRAEAYENPVLEMHCASRRKAKKASDVLVEASSLTPGDLMVHADHGSARYLYEKIEEAFETETAQFKRSELYDSHPSAKRRSATTSFQAGLGHGICAKLDRLKADRDVALSVSGGRDLVPLKENVIEDELAALGMRLKVLQTGRKNLLARAYKTGCFTGENLEWEDKLAAA